MRRSARLSAGLMLATGVAVIGWWGFESGASEDVSRWNTALVTAVYAAFVTVALVGGWRRPTDDRPVRLLAAATLLAVSHFRLLHPPWLSAVGALVWFASPAWIVATFTEPAPRRCRLARRDRTVALTAGLAAISIATVAVSGPDASGRPADALRAVSWSWFDHERELMVRQPNPMVLVSSYAACLIVWVAWGALLVAAAVVISRRIAGATWLALTWIAVAATLVLSIPRRLDGGASLLDGPFGEPLIAVPLIASGAFAAWSVWAELITPRLMRPETLVVQLDRDSTIDATRHRLARVLGDPSAAIVLPADGAWIDEAGLAQAPRPGRRFVAVTQDGATIARLDLDASTLVAADLLADAAGSLAVSLEARRLAADAAAAAAAARDSAQRLIDVDRAAIEQIARRIESGPERTLTQVNELLDQRPLPLDQIHDELRRSLEQVRAIAHHASGTSLPGERTPP